MISKLNKKLLFIIVTAFLSIGTSAVYAQKEPKNEQQEKEKKKRSKLTDDELQEKLREKQREKQTKEVQKRMKKSAKEAKRNVTKKKKPFYERWFSKRRKTGKSKGR